MTSPAHLVVIPDGNRRFARMHGWPIEDGYAAGSRKGVELVDWCIAASVAHLSVFAASTENVARRPAADLIGMFRALASFCAAASARRGVALHTVGDVDALPHALPGRDELRRLAAPSPGPARLVVHIAANYSSEGDMAPLVAAAAGPLRAAATAAPLRYLRSREVPRADLVIRTGGQRRLSGLFPHQCAHADLWFTDTLWPVFSEGEFATALEWYGLQERLHGE